MTLFQDEHRFAQLVQQIAPHSTLLRTWQLNGGISADMTALEIERPNGQIRSMVVRRPSATTLQHNPAAAANEFKLLQILHALGLATPTPYYLDQSGTIFATPYLVIEYIAGTPQFAPVDRIDFARQFATHLANIHSIDCAKLDLSFLPQRAQAYSEIFDKRHTDVDESLDEGRIRATLASAWPFSRRNAPALLHGDFWPGNVLWRDQQLVAVIDWEDACIGDPLADLAISRLDLLWIFGMETLHAFTRQYQSLMPIDYSNLPFWDLYAALRLVRLAGADLTEWAAFFIPFGRSDITEQTIRAYYRFFITQAFEQLAQ